MDFKTYFVKKMLMGFFIAYTCISMVMMLLGYIYEPKKTFGYEIFLSPLLFSFAAIMPSIILYTKNEITLKEMIIRKVAHLVILETLILSILAVTRIITSIDLGISLALSILVIYMTVNLVFWVHDKKTADELSRALRALHEHKIE